MAEERTLFWKRWPHLTHLYNSYPFVWETYATDDQTTKVDNDDHNFISKSNPYIPRYLGEPPFQECRYEKFPNRSILPTTRTYSCDAYSSLSRTALKTPKREKVIIVVLAVLLLVAVVVGIVIGIHIKVGKDSIDDPENDECGLFSSTIHLSTHKNHTAQWIKVEFLRFANTLFKGHTMTVKYCALSVLHVDKKNNTYLVVFLIGYRNLILIDNETEKTAVAPFKLLSLYANTMINTDILLSKVEKFTYIFTTLQNRDNDINSTKVDMLNEYEILPKTPVLITSTVISPTSPRFIETYPVLISKESGIDNFYINSKQTIKPRTIPSNPFIGRKVGQNVSISGFPNYNHMSIIPKLGSRIDSAVTHSANNNDKLVLQQLNELLDLQHLLNSGKLPVPPSSTVALQSNVLGELYKNWNTSGEFIGLNGSTNANNLIDISNVTSLIDELLHQYNAHDLLNVINSTSKSANSPWNVNSWQTSPHHFPGASQRVKRFVFPNILKKQQNSLNWKPALIGIGKVKPVNEQPISRRVRQAAQYNEFKRMLSGLQGQNLKLMRSLLITIIKGQNKTVTNKPTIFNRKISKTVPQQNGRYTVINYKRPVNYSADYRLRQKNLARKQNIVNPRKILHQPMRSKLIGASKQRSHYSPKKQIVIYRTSASPEVKNESLNKTTLPDLIGKLEKVLNHLKQNRKVQSLSKHKLTTPQQKRRQLWNTKYLSIQRIHVTPAFQRRGKASTKYKVDNVNVKSTNLQSMENLSNSTLKLEGGMTPNNFVQNTQNIHNDINRFKSNAMKGPPNQLSRNEKQKYTRKLSPTNRKKESYRAIVKTLHNIQDQINKVMRVVSSKMSQSSSTINNATPLPNTQRNMYANWLDLSISKSRVQYRPTTPATWTISTPPRLLYTPIPNFSSKRKSQSRQEINTNKRRQLLRKLQTLKKLLLARSVKSKPVNKNDIPKFQQRRNQIQRNLKLKPNSNNMGISPPRFVSLRPSLKSRASANNKTVSRYKEWRFNPRFTTLISTLPPPTTFASSLSFPWDAFIPGLKSNTVTGDLPPSMYYDFPPIY